jgi:DNA invertase Pin-like site-specific DNA recombinase
MADANIYCIIDCRVSDKQQLQGGSLENQEMAGRLVASKNGWTVDKVFRKPHSATTTERDDLKEILQYIEKRRKEGVAIRKYICKSIDRFTRMGTVEYATLKRKLEVAGIDLVDTTGIIQPKKNTLEHLGDYQYSWSIYSPSEAAEAVEALKSKAEARDILTRLVGAEIQLVLEGYAVRRALDGFQNKQISVGIKKRYVREPDPERAPFFQKMFDLRATGMADEQIVAHINALGFKSRMNRRWDYSDKESPAIIGQIGGVPLTVKQLQRYLIKTEYAGVICEKWTHQRPIKAQYDGIVSVDTFNQANRGKVYIDPESFAQAQAGESVVIRYN